MGGNKSKHTFKQSAPKVIVVFGATGAQGGSVAWALLKDPEFKVKVITRKPESEEARALAQAGADVVQADLDDALSIQDALEDVHGVFAVTNYFEHMNKNKEIQQGLNIIDACQSKGVSHLVYSGAENVYEAIERPCPIFDGKADVVEYTQGTGLPLTVVKYPTYMENFFSMNKPQKNEDGTYTLGIPMEGKPFDMVPVAETGVCVRHIFKAGKKFIGKTIGLSSYKATVEEYAAILSKHLGKTFKATEMTAEQYGELGFPGAKELAVMFQFFQSGECDRDVEMTRHLNSTISNFDTWVQKNKSNLLAAIG